LAVAAEQHGREILEVYLQAMRRGDWRAAEPLTSPPPIHKARRRMTALDWAAKLVEENGREFAESFLTAARKGDWRAAEALMNRIYGKPEETVRQVEVNPATAVLKSMSLEEKLELLHSLRREPIALPVVEVFPRPD
jgi:hypothetical protein